MGEIFLNANSDFSKNVFINCPFDESYKSLLKPLLFTIKKLGLSPRIALERYDSGEVRLSKIKELVEESKYSIHDLSRTKSKTSNEYYRFNMPFELGLDLGCRYFHNNTIYKDKKFLILEGEPYSTQKALSDMSFADCKCHYNDAEKLITSIRHWFSELGFIKLQSPSTIWEDYNIFYASFYKHKLEENFRENEIDNIPIVEFIRFFDLEFS